MDVIEVMTNMYRCIIVMQKTFDMGCEYHYNLSGILKTVQHD